MIRRNPIFENHPLGFIINERPGITRIWFRLQKEKEKIWAFLNFFQVLPTTPTSLAYFVNFVKFVDTA